MTQRTRLPQLDGGLFLTDGGLETVLIFHEGRDLPGFAAFGLLDDPDGVDALRRYFAEYVALARRHGAGLVLESPTWRASPRWGRELGYSPEQIAAFNRRAIALMAEIRDGAAADVRPVVISGCIGPQDDGYRPAQMLSAAAAERYHAAQIGTFADTPADMVTAMTITYADEAVGIARAAARAGIPVAISFTVETDGALPSGQPLGAAIEEVDDATGGAPAYYMINCAHPAHFAPALEGAGPWRERILGVRPNASLRSHAELDESEDLDDGDPEDLAARCAALRPLLPRLRVLGGCCGTDHRHVGAIGAAWTAQPAAGAA